MAARTRPMRLLQAFGKPAKDNTLRIVVFLTDGYIGNESEVLKIISDKIGTARIYALGVGTSVNRFLLDRLIKPLKLKSSKELSVRIMCIFLSLRRLILRPAKS
jgi:hypothetical protein